MEVKFKTNRKTSLGAIAAFQHILLWSALYVTASTAYMIVSGVITTDVMPAAILLLVSVSAVDHPAPSISH